jgi:hypothetical protein
VQAATEVRDPLHISFHELKERQYGNPIVAYSEGEIKKINPRHINNRLFLVVFNAMNVLASLSYAVSAYGVELPFEDKDVLRNYILPAACFSYNFMFCYCFLNEARKVSLRMRWQSWNAFNELQRNPASGVPLLLLVLAGITVTSDVAFQASGVFQAVWQYSADKTKGSQSAVTHEILTEPSLPHVHSLAFLSVLIVFCGTNLSVSEKTSNFIFSLLKNPVNVFFAALDMPNRSKEFQIWFRELYSYQAQKVISDRKAKWMLRAARNYVNQQLNSCSPEIGEGEKDHQISDPSKSPLLSLREDEVAGASLRLNELIALANKFQTDKLLDGKECLSLFKISYAIYSESDVDWGKPFSKENMFSGKWKFVYLLFGLLFFYSWFGSFENQLSQQNPVQGSLESVMAIAFFSLWAAKNNTISVRNYWNPELNKQLASYIYQYKGRVKTKNHYWIPLAFLAILSTASILNFFLSNMVNHLKLEWLKWSLTGVTILASWGFDATATENVVMHEMTQFDLDAFCNKGSKAVISLHAMINALLDVQEEMFLNASGHDSASFLDFLHEHYLLDMSDQLPVSVYQREIFSCKEIADTADFLNLDDACYAGSAAIAKIVFQWTIWGVANSHFTPNVIVFFYGGSVCIDWVAALVARVNAVKKAEGMQRDVFHPVVFLNEVLSVGSANSLLPTVMCVTMDFFFLRWFCHFLVTKSILPPSLDAGPISDNFIYGVSSFISVTSALWPSIHRAMMGVDEDAEEKPCVSM